MNKNDFIDILEKNLLRLPKADRDDIISDYEAHFALGADAGKTEEEVSASLGDPAELAAVYLENLPVGAKGAPVQPETEEKEEPAKDTASAAEQHSAPSYTNGNNTAKTDVSNEKKSPDAGAIVGVILLCIVALFVFGFICNIWFAVAGSAIGCFTAAVALVGIGAAFASQSVLVCIGGILLGIALIALGILCIVGAIAGVHGIIYLVKQFIKLCKNILNGGNE